MKKQQVAAQTDHTELHGNTDHQTLICTSWISLLPVHPEIFSAVVSAIQADVSKHFDRRILVMRVPIKDTPNAEHRGVARLRPSRVDRKSAG